MEPFSVAFATTYWTDMYDAVITVRGVLRTEPDGLVLESRSTRRDYVSAAKEGEIHAVHIPWTEVQSITFKRRFLRGGALVLRTRSMRALEGVPTAQGSEVTLPVARAESMAARELAANVELALAEQRLAALDAPAYRSALPPP